MNKLISLSVAFVSIYVNASVPQRWTVETSRLQPAVFDVVHGESIELEASMQSYGKPLSMAGKAVSIFWQTNGMESAWWSAPAQVRTASAPAGGAATPTNVIAATFTPQMDPGAATVTGFLGATGDIYRAAFTLRFRKGPGHSPNALPLPTRTINWGEIQNINADSAPFAIKGGAGDVHPAQVTNISYYVVALPSVTNAGAVAAASADAAANYLKTNSPYGSSSVYWDDQQGYLLVNGTMNVAGSLYVPRWGSILNIDGVDLGTVLAYKAEVSSLATVATSGSYDDLNDRPNLSTVALSGEYNDLSGKPELATVATSGSYNDLYDKPDIPTQSAIETYAINAVSNSPSLWNASNAKLTATIATQSAYASRSNTAYVALNQSVQGIRLADNQTLTITAPAPVEGRIRDWVVDVICNTDSSVVLTGAAFRAADNSVTNIAAGTQTTLYFSESPLGFIKVGKAEMKEGL